MIRSAPAAPGVVVLSTNLLTDRMLLHSGFLPALARGAAPRVWTPVAGRERYAEAAAALPARFEDFPAVREHSHAANVARRLLDYAWDHRGLSASRKSFWRLRRRSEEPRFHRLLWAAGACVAGLRMQGLLERWLEPRLLAENRSEEALGRLKAQMPDALLTTSPFRFQEPAVVAAAKRLGIPVLAFITSWDNLSTKARMVLRHDAYLVWSEAMREELHAFYPSARRVPCTVVGAPQFDPFFQERFHLGREEFLRSQGLDPARPVILYALGSPNLIEEHHGLLALARRMREGALGEAQLLVRPHPLFHAHPSLAEAEALGPWIRVQRAGQAVADLGGRFQDEAQVREWVNSLRHAQVVVNLSSTLAVDAAILDRPVVNLDYDPAPDGRNRELVHEINHVWNHFKPIAESGGLALVGDLDATVAAIRAYQDRPALHREGRRRIVERVCGVVDGRAGERMGDAVLDFLARRSTRA